MSAARLREKIRTHRRRYAPEGVSLDVELLGRARLRGWRLAFDLFSARQECLVVDIVEGGLTDEVWGALYELDRELVVRSDNLRSVLDRIEGHRTEIDPENYSPLVVEVDLESQLRSAYTYVGRDDARRRCATNHSGAAPRADYVQAILDGARSIELPAEYIRAIAEASGR
jgi:hypothetical protein